MTGEHRTSSRVQALARVELSVLLVNGDATERTLVARMLEQDPVTRYFITEVSTGCETLDSVRAHAFDCLLVDSELPDGSIPELLEQLGKIADLATLPVVISLRRDRDAHIEEAFRAGAVDFVVREKMTASDLGRTLRYAAERARFQNMRSQLARSQRLMSLGQVAASVAHEINNPAAFILANLVACQSELRTLQHIARANPDAQRILADMTALTQDNIDGIRRIAAIVEDMRVLSHPRTESVEMVDLEDVVKIAAKLLGKKLDAAGTFRIDFVDVPKVAADRGRLIQVFINLLDNASMALASAKNERLLTVSAVRIGEFVELTVKDTGSGMPPDVAARAFEPFFTTKNEGQGTGLGLSICAEYVHLHAGEISLESEIGRGTRVVVRLPLNTGLVPQSERAVRAPETVPRGAIVIVDDEPPLLRAFSRVLAPHHNVITFERAKDALTALRGGLDAHAILCDVNMPDLDGPSLYRELLEFSPTHAKRVIFCTGGSFSANARKVLLETGVEVLTKPVSPETLLRAIAKVVPDRKEFSAGAA